MSNIKKIKKDGGVKEKNRYRKQKLDPAALEQLRTIEEDAKKAAKLSKMYFNASTQESIVAYQNATEKKQKNELYLNQIRPAFEKLAENLINIHRFTSLYDSYEDLKSDCVNFLFETIYKFDATRGTNAFSYFNVVAKNWLIIKTKQGTQKIKRNVYLDDPNALNKTETKILEESQIVQPDFEIDVSNDNKNLLEIFYSIRSHVKTSNELSCINSIITVFENIEDIDLLNKSAILLYMRELSGLTPKQLTATIQIIKKHYKKIKVNMLLDEEA
jgi:hypothetical protein